MHKIEMSREAYIAEHRRLLKVLNACAKEKVRQAKDLKEALHMKPRTK
jgi:hypothetical protein